MLTAQVDEFICTEVESLLAVGGAPGADDIGTGLSCKLGHDRTDGTGRAMREDALPCLKAAMLAAQPGLCLLLSNRNRRGTKATRAPKAFTQGED